MNISVIGTGYLGLVTGACFAEFGMNVICMDIDEDKIKKLKDGIVPLFEPELENIVRKNYFYSKRLSFTTSIMEAVEPSEIIFIAVSTPTQDNCADLQYIFQTAREIGRYLNEYKVIVNKSTVPVGTGQLIKNEIKNMLEERKKIINFDVVSNPEFLREGSAVNDFINPSRIVIGAENEQAINNMKRLYNIHSLLNVPIIITNIESAEMIKYASNTFLATKISFINEIANTCELCDADINVVANAMGLDDRIGSKFLKAGPGFGGSCFPKDTKAFIGFGKSLGYEPKIIKSVVEVNNNQPKIIFKKIKKALKKIRNKTISILGLAFKPETDDVRESPSISVIKELIENGAKVKVYDPKAMENTKKLYPEMTVEYCNNIYNACCNSDCIALFTEWDQFKNLNFLKLKSMVRTPIFLDLRNIYESDYVKKFGFEYQGVGRK